jgi:hypothetical protein
MILELCLVMTMNTEKLVKACDNTGDIYAVNGQGIVRLNDTETRRLDNVDATSERVTLIGFKLPANSEDLSK